MLVYTPDERFETFEKQYFYNRVYLSYLLWNIVNKNKICWRKMFLPEEF